MMKRTLSVVAGLALIAGAGMAADWPNFLGPNKNSISPETGINKDWAGKPPKTLWTAPLHDQGYAGPSVAGGTLYIVDHVDKEDVVLALDLESGSEKWRFIYEAPGGENYGFVRATPAVDGGRVYTVSRDGVVHCFDTASGEKLWRQDALKDVGGKVPRWGVSSSPLVDGERVIVAGGGSDAHMLALNKENGKELWRGGGTDKLGYATPLKTKIDGRDQYLVFAGTTLRGIDARSGELLWDQAWKTRYDVNAAMPVPLGNGRVFVSSGYRRGCAVIEVDKGSASIAWENKEIVAHFNSAILVKGLIYGTGDPGYLVCLDPRDGTTKWKQKDFEKGGLVGIDGHMIVMNGRDGDAVLVEINPGEYREKGRIRPLGGQTWVAPIVADKKLIVRNREKLAVLDLQ